MSIAKGIQSLFTPFTFFLRFEVEKEQEDYSEEDIYEVSTVVELNQVKKNLSKTYSNLMIRLLKKFVRIEVKLFVYI